MFIVCSNCEFKYLVNSADLKPNGRMVECANCNHQWFQESDDNDITRTVDPAKGTIQLLYAEDTNLIIFQEYKVNRALIDKDAIYTAEGQPLTTSSNLVIGQVQSYAGEYGIATNPESFAVYGYRKYFTENNIKVIYNKIVLF